MKEKYQCSIEVKVVYGSKRWNELVNETMTKTIESLKAKVEKLGGKVHVRY